MNAGAGRRFRRALGFALALMLLAAGPAVASGSAPTDPIPFTKGSPALVEGSAVDYWTYVPESYDGTHKTPNRLLIWLHGCGGYSSGDIWNVSPGGEEQSWISIAPTGREGECWEPGADQAKVIAALADVSSHFNIDPPPGLPRRLLVGR